MILAMVPGEEAPVPTPARTVPALAALLKLTARTEMTCALINAVGMSVNRTESSIYRFPRLRVLGDCTASRVLHDGRVPIDSALYSISISLSYACLEERCGLVGSGALDVTLRSMAMR
jgi:hypothetical protein